MAQPTNTFDTYDQIGIREDLSDLIFNISPTDTPFVTMCKRAKATNTLHEWQTDALAAPNGSNAHIEGDDTTADASTPTARLQNWTQILKKACVVTGTSRQVDTAGREDEMDYQVAKRMKEIKRDLETIATGNQARVVGDSSTARKMRSLEAWYATNDNRGSGGADGTASAAATDGTQRAFTEALLQDVLQKCYTAGGDPDTIMVGPKNKQVASSFNGGATKFDKTEDKKLVTAVDLYVSDFGELKIVPNRFQRERTVHVLQSDMWALAWLRPFVKENLAKTGDNDKAQIVGEVTLESRNEAASGVIADVNS
jgi:hypothetical protein